VAGLAQALAARLIVRSALERRESRGAHWRRDFPAPAATPHYTVRVRRAADGPRVWSEPVVFSRATPAGTALPATVEIGD
jgi:succinate dehydrogenase/fumarate reductase flavoprotein subunit